MLRAGLRGKRLKPSDDDRRRLAVKAQALGREVLAQIASVATPATLLRWYLCLLFIHPRGKWDYSARRKQLGTALGPGSLNASMRARVSRVRFRAANAAGG